jgi:hypothetical protein
VVATFRATSLPPSLLLLLLLLLLRAIMTDAPVRHSCQRYAIADKTHTQASSSHFCTMPITQVTHVCDPRAAGIVQQVRQHQQLAPASKCCGVC